MKSVFILAVTATCLAAPGISLANPPVGATAPSAAATGDKTFCIRTKGDRARPGDCLFASYQECKTSIAAVYAECYRNPRMAHAHGSEKR